MVVLSSFLREEYEDRKDREDREDREDRRQETTTPGTPKAREDHHRDEDHLVAGVETTT